jgi:hypothetical protein
MLRTTALLGSFLFVFASLAAAQPPILNAPFPMGAQRGSRLELTLEGKNLHDPLQFSASFPAQATFPTDHNNGKDPGKLRINLEVPADAPLGWHSLRLATKRGLSNFRLFCIDDLPQVLKAGSPNTPQAAQPVPVPCVICGTMQPEITDHYKITVQAGQRISFEMLGRRLGSPLDPQLTLLQPGTLRQLAFSDDAPAQGKDPRFTHVFKEAGDYLLEVRDVRYQGGGDWHYRLRLGDFPLATAPVPLAAGRGTSATIHFAGPHVDLNQSVTVNAPTDPNLDAIPVWPRSQPVFPERPNGLAGWPVLLRLSDLPELVETDGSAQAATAPMLPIPSGISGRFLKPGEKDYYRVTLTKGQRIIAQMLTHQAHSPTTVYFTLNDADGKQLAASDPAAEPARIDFTAPADGVFTFAAEHLHYNAGPDEAYRLEVRNYEPGFALSANSDRLTLTQNGGALLTIQAERRDYNGPISIAVQHPPGVSGQATLAEGKSSVLMLVQATDQASLATEALRLVGTATIGGKPLAVPVRVDGLVKQSLASLAVPPVTLGRELAVRVLPAAPLRFEAAFVYPEGVRGLPVPLHLTVHRQADFDEEVRFTTQALPAAPNQPPPLPPLAAKLPKGQSALRADLKPTAQTPDGVPLFVIATTKAGGIDYSLAVALPPLRLTLPHELAVEAPAEVRAAAASQAAPSVGVLLGGLAAPGDFGALAALDAAATLAARPKSGVVKVKAVRKGGYAGPIAIELKNLPAGVTAAPATIPDQQTEIVIPLTIAADAAPGKKADIVAVGTALTAAGAQNSSPPFTINVVK